MKKRIYWCLSVCLFLGLLGLFFWIVSDSPNISASNALRLSSGMSEKKVQAILGSPGSLEMTYLVDGSYQKVWVGNDIKITIFFSNEGHMISGHMYRSFVNSAERLPLGKNDFGYELSLVDKICVWFGLPTY